MVVLFGFRTQQYMVTSAYVEDALAAANLASAVIDLQEYGKTHRICIQEPEHAFEIFRESLCYNLQLDSFLNATNRDVLASGVRILDYRIYNVAQDIVQVYVLDENGVIKEYQTGICGSVFTPDGVCVETTTIYSKVSFEVKGIGEQIISANKEKSVDIVRCECE